VFRACVEQEYFPQKIAGVPEIFFMATGAKGFHCYQISEFCDYRPNGMALPEGAAWKIVYGSGHNGENHEDYALHPSFTESQRKCNE
jgi:hypothetical protein